MVAVLTTCAISFFHETVSKPALLNRPPAQREPMAQNTRCKNNAASLVLARSDRHSTATYDERDKQMMARSQNSILAFDKTAGTEIHRDGRPTTSEGHTWRQVIKVGPKKRLQLGQTADNHQR